MKRIDHYYYPEHTYFIFIDLLNIFLNMNNLMKTYSEQFASSDYWWVKHEKMFETPKIDKFDKVIVYPSKHTSCSCSLLLPQLSKNRQVLIFDDLLVKPVFVLKPSMYVNEFILNHSNCYSLFQTDASGRPLHLTWHLGFKVRTEWMESHQTTSPTSA